MTESEVRDYYEKCIEGYEFEDSNKDLLLEKLIENSKIIINKEIESDIDDMLILLFDMKEEGFLYIEKQDLYIDNNLITFMKYEIPELFINDDGFKITITELISEYL